MNLLEADAEHSISWTQFCKANRPQCKFTFWKWFYGAMKLIHDHLLGPWRDGSIIGFISVGEAKELLLRSPPGTFLLRFSDSALGNLCWLLTTYVSLMILILVHCGVCSPRCHFDFLRENRRGNSITDSCEIATPHSQRFSRSRNRWLYWRSRWMRHTLSKHSKAHRLWRILFVCKRLEVVLNAHACEHLFNRWPMKRKSSLRMEMDN